MYSLNTLAQSHVESCKDVEDIALMERLQYQRLMGNQQISMASANFDVKYYRCEWEVDPAVRAITGKVTVYYLIISSTNSISLDLTSFLITDSVKQKNNLLFAEKFYANRKF